MAEHIKKNIQVKVLSFFIAVPLMIWSIGSYPQRTLLKDSLSVATILAFSLLIGLFYLARPNSIAMKKSRFSSLLSWHKFIGYLAVSILLVHPVLLVVPRFFEAGIAPGDAFSTIVTTFSSPGVLLGLISWSLLLVLGLTSLSRRNLPLNYEVWRKIHGVMALLCLSSAVFHTIDLGRHMDIAMTAFISLLSAGGIYLLLRSYINQNRHVDKK